MKKHYDLSRTSMIPTWKSLFAAFVLIFACQSISAQVDVTATAGTPAASYTTVKLAFDAINAGTHQGVIAIFLTGNTTETASAVLNSGAVGPASYTSVGITATVPVTVSGTIVGAIIKLNGADNVTIDGRIGGVGRNITVQNNSTAGATAAVWLASVVAGNGCTNNTIRNLELACGANQSTGTNSTFGILMNGTTVSTTSNGLDNDNNTFTANRIIRCRYGIVTRGTAASDLNQNISVTNNIVGPASFGADQIGKVGIFMQADNLATVSGNTVQFVGGAYANTTNGADRVGIAIGSESWAMTPTSITSSNYTVKKNIIHDVIEERTFSAVGLLLATTNGGAATNNLVVNNFIYNVKANGTGGDFTAGLGIAGGHTDIVANNSISLTGDVDPNASAGASTMFGSGISIPNASSANFANLTLANNSVYMDLSSSSTAANRYYAISGPSAAYSFGTGGENYNNYYTNPANFQTQTGGLGTVPGSTLTTQFLTLTNWQAAYTVPQDANSIQANPTYASTTSDLHLIGSSPNINAGATIGSITEDFDGEVRPNGGNYDIGADEFYASPGTLQLSSATYSANEGTNLVVTVNRVGGSSGAVDVTYTLSDLTAAGAAACGLGVDYTNAGPQILSFGDTVTSMVINIPLCTDLVADPAETFTVTLSGPTGGASLGAPIVATATITDVPPPFNGTYTVGTAGNYPSLTNAGGIFEAINLGGAAGNITINIISDLAGELGTNALNEIAGGYTVLIQPSGAPRTITGSVNGALLKLNGADGVTINGSTTGATAAACLVGGDAALRELTIMNTNVGTSTVVISVQSGTNGAMNNVIKNVNVQGQDPLTSLAGISLGGNTPNTIGTDNDNNRVENCSIQKAIYGIYSAGASLANQNNGTVIKQNDLSATGANRIRRVGMFLLNEAGANVTYNSVGGIDTNESADAIGIGVGTQGVDTTSTTSGGITGAVVSNNKVNGVNSSSATGFSAAGIAISGATGGFNVIQNNMISGVISFATSPDIPAGIYVIGAAGADTRLYNNTVSMSGDRGAVASQMPSYGIAITGTDPVIDLVNNILSTTQTASGGGANAKAYAIGMVSAAFTNLNSNYNDFVSSGANDGGFRTGSLGSAAGVEYATVALWGAAVSDDANSIEVAPVFVSASDLHLDTALNASLSNLGAPVAVTVDYDCDLRNFSTPDMGADEFVLLNVNQFDMANGLKAYPNPVKNTLNIEYTNELTNVTVFNLLGQQVLAKKVTATSTQIDMSSLKAGAYMVKVEANNVSKTIKVVKQ